MNALEQLKTDINASDQRRLHAEQDGDQHLWITCHECEFMHDQDDVDCWHIGDIEAFAAGTDKTSADQSLRDFLWDHRKCIK